MFTNICLCIFLTCLSHQDLGPIIINYESNLSTNAIHSLNFNYIYLFLYFEVSILFPRS